jgi:transcriptional regulator with XRE-family HTH domain
MLNINISTPVSTMKQLKTKFKNRRLFLNLTQSGLSKRSGVSLGSLKRFESSGHISLESLLKLSLVLECLDDFGNIAEHKEKPIGSLDEIMQAKVKSVKKRGSIK